MGWVYLPQYTTDVVRWFIRLAAPSIWRWFGSLTVAICICRGMCLISRITYSLFSTGSVLLLFRGGSKEPPFLVRPVDLLLDSNVHTSGSRVTTQYEVFNTYLPWKKKQLILGCGVTKTVFFFWIKAYSLSLPPSLLVLTCLLQEGWWSPSRFCYAKFVAATCSGFLRTS